MSKESKNELAATNASANEIVLYQPNDKMTLEVKLNNETVWLSLNQMTCLFGRDKSVISRHIRAIFQEGELNREGSVAKNATVQMEGNRQVLRDVEYYNLNVIISVGYRVKSQQGTAFRIWATEILKDYMLKGYAINQRLISMEERIDKRIGAIENTLAVHQDKIDFFVRTSLPPQQGIFFDGQIFDAYTFINERIREAKEQIILIDNYIDDSVLTMLDKRQEGVRAKIYTKKLSTQLQLDIEKHNAQYAAIEILEFDRAHDRFLCIDETVYHLGASIKDLGKKWFAFNRMEMNTSELLQRM
ncbi:MAG: virulence RhuM family protein [Paludibacteraceae bacterium]|nr:virulence RhuM family protein [Paludibacteraceae bacterium]